MDNDNPPGPVVPDNSAAAMASIDMSPVHMAPVHVPPIDLSPVHMASVGMAAIDMAAIDMAAVHVRPAAAIGSLDRALLVAANLRLSRSDAGNRGNEARHEGEQQEERFHRQIPAHANLLQWPGPGAPA